MIEPLIIRIDKGNVYWYDIELKKRKYGFFFFFFGNTIRLNED